MKSLELWSWTLINVPSPPSSRCLYEKWKKKNDKGKEFVQQQLHPSEVKTGSKHNVTLDLRDAWWKRQEVITKRGVSKLWNSGIFRQTKRLELISCQPEISFQIHHFISQVCESLHTLTTYKNKKSSRNTDRADSEYSSAWNVSCKTLTIHEI